MGIEWILLGTASVSAILVGIYRYRPLRRAPWLLLAGAITALAVGDIGYEYDRMGFADGCYLLMFGLVVLSLLYFTRDGALLVNRARLIDMLAMACSTLLVIWVFIIGSGGQLGAVNATDVIGSLLLIGVAARLAAAAPRNVAALLLLIGAVGLLVGDIAFPLMPSALTESAYAVLYLSWGLAALHPSMARLTEPRTPEDPSPWKFRWNVWLAAAAITPPTVLLIEALNGEIEDGLVIAITTAITMLLIVTRLADAIHQHSQALTRERGLRTANTALVAAADPSEVDAAVRAAIERLLPPNAVSRVVLATDDDQVAREGVPPAPLGAESRSWWAPADDPEERILICPLRLEPLAVARPSGGALILTGRREALITGRDSLEVLAGEAALALDRITLVEAMGRRDSDNYLRTVVPNSGEMMAVIDSDQRIRYASPALRRLLTGGDDELPPLTALEDVVHPDDRHRVRRALTAQGDGTVHCALQRLDQTQALVELTYRDLREDRLVQGLVVTMRDITDRRDPGERAPFGEFTGEQPARINRRSAQHKFRY